MNSDFLVKPCPICNVDVENYSERYADLNIICKQCNLTYEKVDENGDKIDFTNIDIFGGLQSIVMKKDGSTIINKLIDGCFYMNNIKCRATEYRFGGVIFSGF
jgi:hypothetical protein